MKKVYDVIVIGAGIVGVSTARHLQQKGHSILLMEKDAIAGGTSYGNAGILDTGYILPFYPPSISQWPKIALGLDGSAKMRLPDGLKYLPWIADYYLHARRKKRIECGTAMRPLIENAVADHQALLQKTKGLQYLSEYGRAKLYDCEKSFRSGQDEIDILKQYGVECDVYSAEEFREIESDVKPIYHKAVTTKGSRRYTNPQKAIEAMAQPFTEQGGDVLIEAANDIVECDGKWQVNEKYSANNIVFCTGPWTNNLLKPFRYKFPMAMKRGYHQHFSTSAKISHSLIYVGQGCAISQMELGVRITTGVEFADQGTSANPIQIQQILPQVRRLISLNDSVGDSWLGARPCLADSLPVIGASKKYKGLWFNFGHGHVGLTAGPSSGKLLAQMISGEKTFCDPVPYSPYRFRKAH